MVRCMFSSLVPQWCLVLLVWNLADLMRDSRVELLYLREIFKRKRFNGLSWCFFPTRDQAAFEFRQQLIFIYPSAALLKHALKDYSAKHVCYSTPSFKIIIVSYLQTVHNQCGSLRDWKLPAVRYLFRLVFQSSVMSCTEGVTDLFSVHAEIRVLYLKEDVKKDLNGKLIQTCRQTT